MPNIWADAMASLSGDAAAKARLTTVATNAAGAVDSVKSLIGSARPTTSAPSVPEATGDDGAPGLLPGGISTAQVGVGLSALAVVLWLALRGR